MFNRVTRSLVLLICCSVLIVGGCNKGKSNDSQPKTVLAEYIQRSFAVSKATDKAGLLELLTGDAKTRLSAWSDEQFSEFWIHGKRNFVRLVIHDQKKLTDSKVNITYELEYDDRSKGKDLRVTQMKNASLLAESGTWKIDEVRNIKELIEYKDELSLP